MATNCGRIYLILDAQCLWDLLHPFVLIGPLQVSIIQYSLIRAALLHLTLIRVIDAMEEDLVRFHCIFQFQLIELPFQVHFRILSFSPFSKAPMSHSDPLFSEFAYHTDFQSLIHSIMFYLCKLFL